MKTVYRLAGVIGAAFLLLAVCLVTVIAHAAPAIPATTTVDHKDLPLVGFVADGDAVNTAGQSGEAPSLMIEPNTGEPWVALVQNNQLIVSKFVSTTKKWTQQGNALNFNPANAAATPSLDFGGANHDTAWVAWTENISGTNQVLAARLDGSQWTFTGSNSNGAPIVNQPSGKFVYDPVLTTGATITGAEPLPWLAWGEGDGALGQLEIPRAVNDAAALGGIRWQAVSAPSSSDSANKPDLVFAGPGKLVPWLAWSTSNDTGSGQVFAARALSDTTALGGFRWEKIGAQANCDQAACLLNGSDHFASGIRMAAGALAGETQPTPWVVFTQVNDSSAYELHVMRLDLGDVADPSDDRFIPVGGAVNSQCLERDGLTANHGLQPDIYFVGNVPHVAWIEKQNGVDQLLVCHLADARPGQERWDLDTILPVNRQPGSTAGLPSLGSNGTTPYVAWQETENSSNIFVAHRTPDGPAWGRNYPPFIRTISWSRNLVGQVFATDGIQRALDHVFATTKPILFTTSCDHVNGWDQIKEIHFKLANAKMTAFVGKYVVAEDRVYVEDPAHPGTFLGGARPGEGAPIETAYVILNVMDVRTHSHGAGSAVFDIDWPIVFKETTKFQDFIQSVNIVYADGQATGFFNVGSASLDYRAYLPAVNK